MKKRLTPSEEFELMKMVLDKFLWLGTLIMGFGLYKVFTEQVTLPGMTLIIVGAVVLIIFLLLIVKEYEIIK
ncbi:hypothetical protein HYU14_04980 [Candidatus Woesearchaeota archaeon]|nr:hypothetical protein [Candidatus Woesearchaeota archaeon]